MRLDRLRTAAPLTKDAVLAGVLTLVGQLELVAGAERVDGPLWVQHVAFGVMTAAVALRRRAPLAGAVVCALGLLAQTAAGEAPVAAGFVAMLVLLASLGYHAGLREGLWGTGALLLAGASYELMGAGLDVADLAVNVLLLVGGWLLARRVRVHYDARVAAEVAGDRAARDAVDAERARIARDLHDSVAHEVTLITLQAGAARERTPDPATADTLRAIEDGGRRALEDMHRFLRLLGADAGSESPGLLDVGAIAERAQGAGLLVEVETSGDVTTVPASLSATGYRVVQEALTNVLKHSDARRARVQVAVDASGVHIEVLDDGTAGPRLGTGAGRGIPGLRDRLDLFGGRLAAEPAAGGGWRVSAWLPVTGAGT